MSDKVKLDYKMTDEEIEKALECCGSSVGCEKCPIYNRKSPKNCQDVCFYVLDYIKRLKCNKEEPITLQVETNAHSDEKINEAIKQLQKSFDLYYKSYWHIIDQIKKSFAYMKSKIAENKEEYKNLEVICDYEEIGRIYDSVIRELDMQLDTIMNGDKAEHFKNPYTLDYFLKDEHNDGFLGGL